MEKQIQTNEIEDDEFQNDQEEFEEEDEEETEPTVIKEVVVDGLVILKIVKHSQENMPNLVRGQLLGIDSDDSVEVSNCFPFPNGLNRTESAKYQATMIEHLNKAKCFDTFKVGWYVSTYLGSYLNRSFISSQYNYQSNKLITDKCIVLVYDEIVTRKSGTLSIKAVRLTDKFMRLPEARITHEHLRNLNLTYDDVFEEIPVRIKNSCLVDAFLHQLENSKVLKPNFSNLDLSFNLYMQRSVEFLSGDIDELNSDFNSYRRYFTELQKQKLLKEELIKKRIEENKLRKSKGLEELSLDDFTFKTLRIPARNNSLTLSNQLSIYSKQISQYANDSLTKLFLKELLRPGAIETKQTNK